MSGHPQMQMPGQFPHAAMPGHQPHLQMQGQHPPNMHMPMPGQHLPHMQVAGQQHAQHMAGHPMQGVPLQASSPHYLAFNLVPITLPDGKQSWVGIVPQQLNKTQQEFAEIIKNDKINKIKVSEVYQSLTGEKKRQVDRILDDHKKFETNPNLEWKLASIKLKQVDLVNGLAKLLVGNKTQVNRIRVILKKVPRSPTKGMKQPVLLPPMNIHVNQQPQMAAFPPHEFQQRPPQNQVDPRMFNELRPPPPPPLPQGGGQVRPGMGPGRQGGQPAIVPLGRVSAAEVVSDHEDDRRRGNRGSQNNQRNDRRERSVSPKIRIPNFRDRRDSKTSSRNTYDSYDSDALSPGESPNTSRSNSPRHWPDSRRRSGHSKKYHSRKGSEYSKRDRRGSSGSNDSFVIVPGGQSPRRHGSTSSHGTRAIESWTRGISGDMSSNRRRDSYRNDDLSDRALARNMQKLQLAAEIESREDRLEELEHLHRISSRLSQLERSNVVHQEMGRYGRPVLNRARSDMASIGYMPRQRFGGSTMFLD